MRRLILLFFFELGCMISYAQIHPKIASELAGQLTDHQSTNVLIVLKGQASVERAYQFKTKEEKGKYVFETLRKNALNSQSEIIEYLIENEVSFQAFYIVNAISAKINDQIATELALWPQVAETIPDPWIKMEEPELDVASDIRFREGIEWGIKKINADKAWELGFKGQGVIIGGQDTGYEWTHPALMKKYKGWNQKQVDHNYAWYDAINEISELHRDSFIDSRNNPCGLNVQEPCDDGSHGTHTMGTIVGDDEAGNQIGVAPEAKWIGCRCMERGWGKPSTYIDCFEWFLAPKDLNGEQPDPLKAPHVINNSWACPEIEGCNPSNWELMERVINNLHAAGIVVVVSAGNSGSNCHSIKSPAAIYENSLSIGATMQNDTIARFSSRGTVTVDGSNRTKPDLAAPGVSVRSAIANGRYASFNGTSMAGPHVAGAIALMLSAKPELSGNVEMIERILKRTAMPMPEEVDCHGGSGRLYPNNTYGYGRIDALAAVKEALRLTTTSVESIPYSKIQLFPNPFSDELSISVEESLKGQIEFELFDGLGHKVYSEQWIMNGGIKSKSFSLVTNLPKGIYHFKLKHSDQSWVGKILKQ